MFCEVISPNTLPVIEPDRLRSYCRVLDSSDDDVLQTFQFTAIEMVQDMCGRVLLPTTYRYTFDTFVVSRPIDADFWYTRLPYGIPRIDTTIKVPRPPLTSVTSFKYYDTGNVQRTLVENTDFRVDKTTSPARIQPINFWPATYNRVGACELVFVAGYADAKSVPIRLSTAVLQLVAYWYENREAQGTFPIAISALVDDYVIRGYK